MAFLEEYCSLDGLMDDVRLIASPRFEGCGAVFRAPQNVAICNEAVLIM